MKYADLECEGWFRERPRRTRKAIPRALFLAMAPQFKRVPQGVLDEVKKNRTREAQAAVSIRSEDDIDYTTFGQLVDIILENWSDFAGMLSDQSAVSRILCALNMLRGTIAHCGVLAEDEVDWLKLAIRDWFRVLEGPKGREKPSAPTLSFRTKFRRRFTSTNFQV